MPGKAGGESLNVVDGQLLMQSSHQTAGRSQPMQFSTTDTEGDEVTLAVTHGIPIDQPDQVHQLTPILFSAYEVEGGTVTLGGCLLEDIPFVRLEWVASPDRQAAVQHLANQVVAKQVVAKQVVAKQGAAKQGVANQATAEESPNVVSSHESCSGEDLSSAAAASDESDEEVAGESEAAGERDDSSPSTQRVNASSKRPSPLLPAESGWLVVTSQGKPVSHAQAHSRGLDYPVPIEHPPQHVNPQDVQVWLYPLLEAMRQRLQEAGCELVGCQVVWCKRAEGKVVVAIGEHSANLPFSGWARQLATGAVLPPPYRCPVTGRKSYQICAAEDGRLTVPEAMRQCAVSGRRVLETELRECAATGRRCLPEFLEPCDASGLLIMKTRRVTCPACGQHVSPLAMHGKKCVTCKQLGDRPVSKGEVDELLRQFPGLKKWGEWQRAESHVSHLWRGFAWLKSVLIRLDRKTQQPQWVALGSRLGKKWEPVPSHDWPELLGAQVSTAAKPLPPPTEGRG